MNSHRNQSCSHVNINKCATLPSVSISPTSPCDELRRLIHKTHLSYLNREDTPDKLDQKTRLEGLIVEYLSVVSSSHKFSHFEVAECLTESILRNASFSAYKAAVAFEIMEKFAVNLLTKPWRKEFHVICPYGGYFKHTVDKQLFRSEILLYLMGYKKQRHPYSVIHLSEAPLDPDKLASIALDCLVAFVECQIMIQVHDVLKRKGISVSWAEIHDVRLKYICGMDDVVRYIADVKRSCKLIDLDDCLPALNSRYSPQLCKGNYMMNNGWPETNYSSISKRNAVSYPFEASAVYSDDLSRTNSFDLMHFPADSAHQMHIMSPNFYGNLPSIPYITPPPPPMFVSNFVNDSNYQHKPDTVNKGIQAGSSLDVLCSSLGQLNVKPELRSVSNYSQQYDNEASCREAQLVLSKKDDALKPTKKGYFESPFDAVDGSVTDSKNVISEKGTSKKTDSKKFNTIGAPVNTKIETNKIAAKSIKSNSTSKSSNSQMATKSSASSRVASVSLNNDSKAVEASRWSCSSCTFINTPQREICEMCSRSKERGSENLPLVSGGKECPRCTLVNDKNIDYCTACETNLIDSPTYI